MFVYNMLPHTRSRWQNRRRSIFLHISSFQIRYRNHARPIFSYSPLSHGSCWSLLYTFNSSQHVAECVDFFSYYLKRYQRRDAAILFRSTWFHVCSKYLSYITYLMAMAHNFGCMDSCHSHILEGHDNAVLDKVPFAWWYCTGYCIRLLTLCALLLKMITSAYRSVIMPFIHCLELIGRVVHYQGRSYIFITCQIFWSRRKVSIIELVHSRSINSN